ncbi:MAG: Exopolyphosphatase [Syntrophorhabdus sp. PtaU1.Bin058]|nr:MAG: Exopolyphosphatase [Syntrophorhabdus sp. PtaU1.Bin058]
MKCASIDVGTNTILLLIVETENMQEIADVATTVRLGEGLKETGYISQDAMNRGLQVMQEYAGMIAAHGVEYVSCVGTSALREAGNGNEFSDLIRDRLGIRVRIISERDEAYYTYLSVKNDRIVEGERFMIVDIGGGSTEIIAGDREAFQDFLSLPAGSVKLTEMFVRNDPPAGSEMEAMVAYVRQLFDRRFIGCSDVFVGTGGTVATLASIIGECEYFDKDRIHGLHIPYGAICDAVDMLQKMNVAERRAVKGMEKGREDIIVQGIVFLREMMAFHHVAECVVSAKGVRYGVLYEYIAGEGSR